MFKRRRQGLPIDLDGATKWIDPRSMANMACESTVYERRDVQGLADFGYAAELGMQLGEGERALASGPARYQFADTATFGTVLVTDERAMFVWLDPSAGMFLNTSHLFTTLRGYGPAPYESFGFVVAWDGASGNIGVSVGLDPKDPVGNRRAFEWYHTLASRFAREMSGRREA